MMSLSGRCAAHAVRPRGPARRHGFPGRDTSRAAMMPR
ncbi:hypothetical protein ALSL_0117 [Aerosticca soli]|uniref:Uncharacterized protein n=1 Tax=Aerosticca soli TaxID=2010829 RepID=A0A2Z6E228_9GAMM|nr:hypothetical protein ALSL_0117 [Aerosticca soli]